jgi:ABC-type Na+ efflux pump permease subunit
VSLARTRAVVHKELRDYRRNRFVVTTMAVLPFIFLIAPMITLLRIPDSAAGAVVERAVGVTSLLLFVVPIVIPPVITAYSVIGERDQGTLEPFLSTPVRRDELLLGKATAAFVPSVTVAYAIYAIYVVTLRLGAAHRVSDAILHTPQVLAQLLFTPLLATWAIWVGIAMSVRASDVRVAQQLATLASLPVLGFTALISFRVVTPSVPLAVGLALALLAIDVAGWRVVSHMFDRERLITGASAQPDAASPASREPERR